MNWFPILCFATFSSLVYSEEVKTLCEDPIIHAADRLPNNTFRVYRDNHYWELEGLPNTTAKVQGPFPVWYKYMAPIDRQSSVQTVVGGSADGMTWKYRGEKYWLYRKNGELFEGGTTGFDWNLFPSGGFNSVFNDGKMGGNDFPVMIGFSGILVYYYKTDMRTFRRIGSKDGYKNGKDGEKFPSDLTAAFAFAKDENKKNNYYVYLFQRNRYCYRPLIGEDGCKQWRQNKELFGCDLGNTSPKPTNTTGISGETQPQSENPSEKTEDKNPEPTQQESGEDTGNGTYIIVFIVILLIGVAVVIAIVVFGMKAIKGKPKPKSSVERSAKSKSSKA